jgi:hypothetical protein
MKTDMSGTAGLAVLKDTFVSASRAHHGEGSYAKPGHFHRLDKKQYYQPPIG